MNKLFYLSSTDMAQVDMGFLHLLTHNFDVYYHVVIPEKGGNFSEAELSEYAGKHHIHFKAHHFKRRRRDPRIGFEFYNVLEEIRKVNPDVIHTLSFDVPAISLMTLMLSKNKTVVSIHDVKYHSNIPYAFLFKIGRQITMRHFKYFQVLSKHQENVFRHWHPKKVVYTIPLTLSDFGDKRTTSVVSNGPEKIKFLFFGYIAAYKGLDLLLKAVSSLSERYSNFELTIAGRCDTWDELYEPLIKNNAVIRKRIGFIKNDEIPDLFLNAHYLILPYKDATQSGPLMIAYNYNIPVIASNTDAFATEIEDGKTSYLFDLDDPKSLEDTLESALLRENDEYQLVKQRLKQYTENNYGTESIVEKYKQMFLEIIEKKTNQ